jgi:hypothetical protein
MPPVALTLPVTIIGCGATADLRHEHAELAPCHALIALTPAGPAIRTLVPEKSFLNGEPVAASLLKHGDHLLLGTLSLEFRWYAEANQHSARLLRPLSTDRLEELQATRETLRQELQEKEAAFQQREAAVAEREQVLAEQTASLEKQREHVRLIHTRTLKRLKARAMKSRQHRQRQTKRLERELQAHQRTLRDGTATLERQTNQLNTYQQRLSSAWALLVQNQKRLLADRQQAEQDISLQDQQLKRREESVARREEALSQRQKDDHERHAAFSEELASLQARTLHARALLQELEHERAQHRGSHVSIAGMGVGTAPQPYVVSMESPRLQPHLAVEIEQMLSEVHEAKRTAQRERNRAALMNTQLEQQHLALLDDRSVLAEQVAALATARDQWQRGEYLALLELEELTRAVLALELQLHEREQLLNQRDAQLRQQAFEAWQTHTHLDNWQQAMALNEEVQWNQLQSHEDELAQRRHFLNEWEAKLESLVFTWQSVREQEQQQTEQERQRFVQLQELHRQALAATQLSKQQYEQHLDQVAARAMALEEANDATPRRLRVLQKKWDRHYRQLQRERSAAEQFAKQCRAAMEAELVTWVEATAAKHSEAKAEQAETATRQRLALTGWRTDAEHKLTLRLHTEEREHERRSLAELRADVSKLTEAIRKPAVTEATDDEPPILLRAA